MSTKCNREVNHYFRCVSTKYKVKVNAKPYFITTTIVGWIDVFTRKTQKDKLIESLKYCQKNKGLIEIEVLIEVGN